MNRQSVLIPVENIEQVIFQIRGQKVILDANLARLYGVETKVLNQAVKRNSDKFPEDFAFRLTRQEVRNMRSQNVTGSKKHRVPQHLPYAFTEHGALMAANVLRSERAVQMSVYVVRAFVRLRHILASHADLARKMEELEKKYDAQFRVVFDAIRQLMKPFRVKLDFERRGNKFTNPQFPLYLILYSILRFLLSLPHTSAPLLSGSSAPLRLFDLRRSNIKDAAQPLRFYAYTY